MKFILIMIIVGSSTGHPSSVATHEFNDKGTCLVAAKAFTERARSGSDYITVRAVCVKK